MKRTNYFIPTLKEKPSDIEQASQVFMFRAGMLRKVSNGLFVYLPIMLRTIDKVNNVIREELEKANAVEVKFPILVSREILEASGRWDAFGNEMFRLQDRHKVDFAISPTNEEAACFVAGAYLKSYKDLPFCLYQIQQKHRDEISPRNGVMRAREFIMKDAYSFHADEDCLDAYYQTMRETYLKIFKRLGLEVVAVSADTGAMGGSGSQEIMSVSDDGEDNICKCGVCDYAANVETTPCGGIDPMFSMPVTKGKKAAVSYKTVHTPEVKTIEELVSFFDKKTTDFCKAVVFKADKKLVVVLVRGDREVNDVKLKKYLGAQKLEVAAFADIVKSKKTAVGFVGPVGLKGIKIIADYEIRHMSDFIVGANQKDYHYSGVNISDFSCEYADLRWAVEGDTCPLCNGAMTFKKATELGHIFKLGQRYTAKLGLQFATDKAASETMTMGCYGIGVERTIASIVEQNRDEKGIIWPKNIAPFAVDLITVDTKNPEQMKISEILYKEFKAKGIDVLWDDTDARPGSKFADCELIGFPIREVVGRGIERGLVEVVAREDNEKKEIAISECAKMVVELLKPFI